MAYLPTLPSTPKSIDSITVEFILIFSLYKDDKICRQTIASRRAAWR